MATKFSGHPSRPWLDIIRLSTLIFICSIIKIIRWEHAIFSAAGHWHDHLSTSLACQIPEDKLTLNMYGYVTHGFSRIQTKFTFLLTDLPVPTTHSMRIVLQVKATNISCIIVIDTYSSKNAI